MTYLLYFLLSLGLALLFTPWARRLAFQSGYVDKPRGDRHIHTAATPTLGGVVIVLVVGVVSMLYAASGMWDFSVVPLSFVYGILIGALLLLLGGFLDDRYELSAKYSFVFPALASLVVILSGVGVGITSLSNPFGGIIPLTFNVIGVPASGIFVWVWLIGMTYTTKLLDGLDGLAAGVSLIAGLVMFALSLTSRINQPVTAALAIIFVGALLGYLVYAFYPARIFLGEGGSTFLGWFLGVLSVLTGAKIATAILVMGIPILDVIWAIARRLAKGESPFKGDRHHFHHLLLDAGLSQRQAVLVFYVVSLLFGSVAIFLQSFGKLLALLILVGVMIALVIGLTAIYKRRGPKQISS